jgi:hypothetical protein
LPSKADASDASRAGLIGEICSGKFSETAKCLRPSSGPVDAECPRAAVTPFLKENGGEREPRRTWAAIPDLGGPRADEPLGEGADCRKPRIRFEQG